MEDKVCPTAGGEAGAEYKTRQDKTRQAAGWCLARLAFPRDNFIEQARDRASEWAPAERPIGRLFQSARQVRPSMPSRPHEAATPDAPSEVASELHLAEPADLADRQPNRRCVRRVPTRPAAPQSGPRRDTMATINQVASQLELDVAPATLTTRRPESANYRARARAAETDHWRH